MERGHVRIARIFHLFATLTYFLLIHLNSRNCLKVQRYIRIKDPEAWRSGVQI